MLLNGFTMKKFFYDNSLSIVFFLLFNLAMVGQIFFALHAYIKDLIVRECSLNPFRRTE